VTHILLWKKSVDVIPNNMKSYMAIFLGDELKFIDNFQFMSKSLKSLAENISYSDMKYTSQEFRNKKLELMKKRCLSLRLYE